MNTSKAWNRCPIIAIKIVRTVTKKQMKLNMYGGPYNSKITFLENGPYRFVIRVLFIRVIDCSSYYGVDY